MKRCQDFIDRAMVGNFGEEVMAFLATPQSHDQKMIVLETAIEFGGLSDDEIVKKYGPAPFR